MGKTVLLVGVPNCGKSALFCRLTGGRARVGNFAGVTVERQVGHLAAGEIAVVDTPGICSLTPTRAEERVTQEAIGGDAALLVQVVDGAAPLRSFRLTRELLATGKPLLIAVTRTDLYRARGQMPRTERVAARTGLTVCAVSARTGEGIAALREAITTRVQNEAEPKKSGDAPRVAHLPSAEALTQMLYGDAQFPHGQRADAFLLGSRLAYLPAALTVASLLALTSRLFSLSGRVFDAVGGRLIAALAEWLGARGLSAFSVGFLTEGCLGSLWTALSFLPPLVAYYAITAALDDSGYLARMTFLFDHACARVGLGGGAVMPCLLSLGCGVTGVGACRTLSGREKRGCAGFCTYFPCHAKLPLISAVTAACGLGTIGYLLLFLLPCLFGAVAVALAGGSDAVYVEEIPPLARPSPRVVGSRAAMQGLSFLSRAGGVIALSGATLWLLAHIGAGFLPAEGEASLLAAVSRRLLPALAPIGFSSWEAVAATLAGFLAKENSVVVLHVLGGSAKLGGRGGAIIFCLFGLLSPPCVAAAAQMRRVIGRRAYLYLAAQLLIATATCAVLNLFFHLAS